MKVLDRDSIELIVRERIKWTVKGLFADKDEEAVVWIAKLNVDELFNILSIGSLAQEEALRETCKVIQRNIFSGDTGTMLFENADQVSDKLSMEQTQTLTVDIMKANGLHNDESEAEEQVEAVKNE